MLGIETKFKVCTKEEGKTIKNYYDKNTLFNDLIGFKDNEFSTEVFRRKSIINYEGFDYIIDDIQFEFESIIVEGERILDESQRNKKTLIIVSIFI